MDQKGKIAQIHDLLPKHLNSKNNTNWKALVDALGEADQNTADLVAEVRKQFFVKTASRPYLDRLAANSKIARPRLVGMDDPSFRQYIPVLSYQPKQVKLIIDQLLDIFFFKESTTAFINSQVASPFNFNDGWELELKVDEQFTDFITFKSSDFTDINNATADEIVAAINRQAKYFYATTYYDSISKNTYIRIFTKTVGSKGSLRIVGGRANIALQLNGYIASAGNGSNTEWTVTKVGDEVTFTHTAGTSPNIDQLIKGDIFIVDIVNNTGSFEITNVDLVNNSITFINLFATPGVFTQSSTEDTKFIRPQKFVAYLNPKRAMTWETSPSEVVVEMPTSPPVVKRSLKGSSHINGNFSQMISYDSITSLTVADAFEFPESGTFLLEKVNEIKEHIITPSEDTVISKLSSGRLQYSTDKYNYASRVVLTATGDININTMQITNLSSIVGLAAGQQIKMTGIPGYARIESVVGSTVNMSIAATASAIGQTVKFMNNQLTGITPNLPTLSSLNEFSLSSLVRSGNIVTGTTTVPHGYSIGESVSIANTTGGIGTWNGTYVLTNVGSNTFTYNQIESNSSAVVLGTSRVSRIGLCNSGSRVIITDAITNDISRISGSYVWDLAANFVLSSNKGLTTDSIQAGKIIRLLNLSSNTLPSSGGFLIFDYGRVNQEGPVRFLYKPTENTIAIDPSYTFKYNHSVGAGVVAVNHKGPHVMSGNGAEYSAYITDPSEARAILQELIRSVKSAGIFVNFLVRYPDQLYGTLDVYNQQGFGAGQPFL
jgi:hypothetical protein